MPLDLVQTLSDLVALASVNPMGGPDDGPEFYEHRVTDYLERLFRSLEVPYVRQTVAPRRDNIVARLDGNVQTAAGGRIVLLDAHQDTVPVVGMTIDPWRPVVRDGRLYGRGSCDVKGGLTSMLGAFARLVAERPVGRPTVVMSCTVNEEHGFSGATALERLWTGPDAFLPRRPDAAIVAEPTQLDVVVAHKGVVRWRCHTRGRATHSSQPHLGDNAIFRMAKVLSALERYQREVVPTLAEHSLCGRPSLSVGTIHGGISVNTVPDLVTIEIDRRLTPGEQPQAAYRQVIEHLAHECGEDWPIEHDEPFITSRPLGERDNGALAEGLAAAARHSGIASRIEGVPYGTNAAAISAAGVPSVVFGPGSIDQAHTADEWIELSQVEQASEVIYEFCRAEWSV